MKFKALVICAVSIVPTIMYAGPVGTAFTYQGQLAASGVPANGNYDFTFNLYNTNSLGTPLASPVFALGVGVTNGLFDASLDFGSQFNGEATWLEISVRSNNVGNFVVLAPRQQLTPTPNALFAATANNLSGAIPVTQLTGALDNNQLANSAVTINAGTGLSGGGTVSLGGSTSLINAGVISVAGNGDVTANNVDGAVTLGSTANSTNFPGTIVKRDSNGNFSAGTITLTGALTIVNSENNTAVGSGALGADTIGSQNTAYGAFALFEDTTGNGNTATGTYALEGNTIGGGNTAIGGSALQSCTNGNDNIALGSGAGANIGTGNNNIYIGNPGVAGDNGAVRIGYGIYQTSAYINGIYNTTVSGVAVQVNSSGQLGVASSSRRFKKDIQSMSDASDELLSLRPVTFKYKPEIEPQGLRQFGLIAEEVEQVDPNLVVHDKEHGIYTVRYEAVNALLLNEFLKEHKTVETQSKEIQDLKQSVAELKAMVEKIAGK